MAAPVKPGLPDSRHVIGSGSGALRTRGRTVVPRVITCGVHILCAQPQAGGPRNRGTLSAHGSPAMEGTHSVCGVTPAVEQSYCR